MTAAREAPQDAAHGGDGAAWRAITNRNPSFAPWRSIFPGLTILTTSLGLSLIEQSLQGRIDRR